MYARALFDAAQQNGKVAAARDELADFITALRDVREPRALVENPELDSQLKRAALGDLLADADELVRNFVLLTVEKGRAGELEEIADELEELVAAEEGRLTVELTTAVELDDQEAAAIV